MIVRHPDRLHKRIANRRSDKIEAALLQIAAQPVRFPRPCWNRRVSPTLQGLSIHKPPDIRIETAKFPLDFEKGARILNGRSNLQTIADDSFVGQQSRDLSVAVFRNFLRIELIKRTTILLSLSQDYLPAKPGLRTFKNQELKQLAIVVNRNAPLEIVIPNGQFAFRPSATMQFPFGVCVSQRKGYRLPFKTS